jgi:segregation and condensation protein B
MQHDRQPPALPGVESPTRANTGSASPLSLNRLREAFAAMLGSGEDRGSRSEGRVEASSPIPQPPAPSADPCEINPRSVVEAMLFVGRPDNGKFSARELAAAMRDCSPAEIESTVAELNEIYQQDGAPYEIVGSPNGYQLSLREEFGRVRDKFYGRVREAKLSTAALEVLSIVAYNQPTTAEDINRLRGSASGAALATLVRLRLVRLERTAEAGEPARYSTTDRFLRLFGLETLAALPQSEELEKA